MTFEDYIAWRQSVYKGPDRYQQHWEAVDRLCDEYMERCKDLEQDRDWWKLKATKNAQDAERYHKLRAHTFVRIDGQLFIAANREDKGIYVCESKVPPQLLEAGLDEAIKKDA